MAYDNWSKLKLESWEGLYCVCSRMKIFFLDLPLFQMTESGAAILVLLMSDQRLLNPYSTATFTFITSEKRDVIREMVFTIVVLCVVS